MNRELDEQLCEDFPLIFADRRGDVKQTAMCWGFDVGDGWYDIINCLCILIQNHIENEAHTYAWAIKYDKPAPPKITQVVATQVKEKYGTLRFYYTGGDSYIEGLVDMAELWSENTCELCGNKGIMQDETGWMSVRCEAHKPK